MPYHWYISQVQKLFFFSSQNRFIFKIACALLLFPHDFSNFTPFFVPLNDLWVPLYTFETQFSKSPKPLKTLETIENKRTWAFHSGSNFWRRTSLRTSCFVPTVTCLQSASSFRCRIFHCTPSSCGKSAWVSSRPIPVFKKHKTHLSMGFCVFGGGHGTRTHEAVTPYSLSRRAP